MDNRGFTVCSIVVIDSWLSSCVCDCCMKNVVNLPTSLSTSLIVCLMAVWMGYIILTTSNHI